MDRSPEVEQLAVSWLADTRYFARDYFKKVLPAAPEPVEAPTAASEMTTERPSRELHVGRYGDVLVARHRVLPGRMTWAGGGSAYSNSISAERLFSTCRWLT